MGPTPLGDGGGAQKQERIMPTIGFRATEIAEPYDRRLEEAKLVSRASKTIEEMKNAEGSAYTEDSYTMRIPGKTLMEWREAFEQVLFRLRSEIE